MTSPATPAPDDKKNNRKNIFFSALTGVGMGIISMATAAAVTVIAAGTGGALGVPCLVVAVSIFAFDFVLHHAKTDEFKLGPALTAAAITAGAIGFAFNVAANRLEEERKQPHQSAPVGSVVHDFDRASKPVDPAQTISYADAVRMTRAATPRAA